MSRLTRRHAMPELPEVETIARTLDPLVRGRRVTDARVFLPRCLDKGSLPLESLTGRRIARAGRRGKLALIHLEPVNGDAAEATFLAVHLKMTGRLFVYDHDVQPGPHTRAAWDLDGGIRRLFFDDARTFGYVRLVSPATLPLWSFWNNLGPEPLECAPEDLARRTAKGRGKIKAVLLNQAVTAGIGNIYADEALFRAGIDPRRPARDLGAPLLTELFRRVREVLLESIEQCGSSIRDYRTAQGDAGAFQNAFRVYGRSGQACLTCGAALETAKVAGRTTVFCARCQK